MTSEESVNGDSHWQVVEIEGVGLGEMWFDAVEDGLSQEVAEQRAGRRDRHVAVPMPYDPDVPPGVGEGVDDYDRQVVVR